MSISVATYESELARLLQGRYAVAFAYARHALTSILLACDLGPGDEVILSPLTCKVVPLALLSLGLKPVYADISVASLNLDPKATAAAGGSRTRAILFQHTYGFSMGIAEIAEVANRMGVPLIEDCAQCLPVSRALPDFHGAAAVFSNNLIKPLPAGSGGLAVASDTDFAQRLREIRDRLPPPTGQQRSRHRLEAWAHWALLRPRSYWPLLSLQWWIGNRRAARSREEEIDAEITQTARQISLHQARVGLKWLDQVESVAAHRRLCCAEYANSLRSRVRMRLPAAGNDQPLYYFPVLTENKFDLLERARRRLIELIAWPVRTPIYPVEREDELAVYGYRTSSCPRAEEVAGQLVGLPTHSRVTLRTRRRIIELLTGEGQ